MKYFAVSDIHGFYNELISGLKKAGYDKKNPNHTLIVCGDIFDRGREPFKVYKFLKSIPKKRRVLIRGNHEQLLLALLAKGFPNSYDYGNGTFFTLIDLFPGETSWDNLVRSAPNSDVIKFINSDKDWVNYFETDKYVFVHSFVPDRPDWRKAEQHEWNKAMWGCPWEKFLEGKWSEEKTLVVGHWHTSDFYKHLDGQDIDTHDMYISRRLIAIDGGVWQGENRLCHQQNVFVFEE